MITSRNIRKELRFSDDELLYNYNSIIILYENIELLEALRVEFKKQNPKYVERRNGMLIFDLIVKYCQYAETLGATINGFEKSNKNNSPSSTIVLKYLKDFQVYEINKFFEKIASPDYKKLTDDVRKKLVYAFGYQKLDKSKTDKPISKIFHLLEDIAGVYLSFVNSYNAHKHGHRVWYGYDLNTQKSNSLFYIEREYEPYKYKMNLIALDDSVISNYIIPHSKHCRTLFELILHNNKTIIEGSNNYIFLE